MSMPNDGGTRIGPASSVVTARSRLFRAMSGGTFLAASRDGSWQVQNRDTHGFGCTRHAVIVAGKLNVVATPPQELKRRQVKPVQRPDGNRERVKRPGQYGWRQLDQGDSSDERVCALRPR